MFSNKQWVDPPFCPSEVNGNSALSDDVITGCLPEGCGSSTGPGQARALGAQSDTAKRRKCRTKQRKKAGHSRRCHRKKRR
jgi:hypothetical protein